MDLKQNDINNCKFCSIINSQSLTKLSDKILYEGKYFFIIPALGCFIKDYIMIVSKRHIYSMTSLNKHEKIELNELILKFKRIFKPLGNFLRRFCNNSFCTFYCFISIVNLPE